MTATQHIALASIMVICCATAVAGDTTRTKSEGIKHVNFKEDGSVWASFGGTVRLRGEYWLNHAWNGAPSAEDTFALFRVLAHADIHFSNNFRVFVQGKSALVTDRDLPGGKRPIDVDTLALQQAFFDAVFPFENDTKLTARIGRQALKYGKQRLVSPLPWANSMRAWDAALMRIEFDRWRIDSFLSRYIPPQKYEINSWSPGQTFYGVYTTVQLGDKARPYKLDAYWLGINNQAAVYNGSAGRERRQTLGVRADGMLWDNGMDFDAEMMFQFGEVGGANVTAWAVAIETGRSYENLASKPRVSIGFDYASGDNNAGDNKVETFNQLFPLGHAYLGYMDFVGRQNIVGLHGGALCRPSNKWMLRTDFHAFWRASASDALYNAGGAVVRPGSAGTSSQVGQEIDLTAVYKVNRHLTMQGGYSIFFAGDFLKESGHSSDMHWFYFQTTYRF